MNHGVFTRSELTRLGASERQIRAAVRGGDLVRLRSGWYARPGADPDVVAAVRSGGVLACVSALRHHRIWVPHGRDTGHVRASKSLRGNLPTPCRGHGPPPPTVTAVDPVPVALAHAVNCLTREQWIAACDSALESTSVDRVTVADSVGAHGRELLRQCDGRAQSGTESLVRVRLRALGFRVVTQPRIEGVGHVDMRIGRLLLECDSKAHHTSLENYQNDRRRDRAALRRGWMTMRITYDDAMFGWDDVLDDIRTIVHSDRHRMRGRHRPR